MNKSTNNPKPGSNIVRISRLDAIKPINISINNFDLKKKLYNPSITLLIIIIQKLKKTMNRKLLLFLKKFQLIIKILFL